MKRQVTLNISRSWKSIFVIGSSALLLNSLNVKAQEGEIIDGAVETVYEQAGTIYRDPTHFNTIEEALEYGRLHYESELHVDFYVNWDSNGYYVVDWELKNMGDEDNEEPIISDESFIYTVQPGDSLWAIANRYDVTVDQLIAWNGLSSNHLFIGQELIIQEEAAVEPTPPEEPEQPELGYTVHTVQSGEYLWLIANYYGVTVDEIITWNQLETNALYVGQELIIQEEVAVEPTPPEEPEQPELGYTVHTVQSGEYLWLIANYYGVTVDEIITWNQLETNALYVGQELIIQEEVAVEPTPPEEPEQPELGYTVHTVQSGEYLWLIAQYYGITVDKIINWNNLETNNLHVGQELIVGIH